MSISNMAARMQYDQPPRATTAEGCSLRTLPPPSLPTPPHSTPQPFSRRAAHSHFAVAFTAAVLARPTPAHASLVRFPTSQLNNRYFLVRAGESEAEAQGYVLSNPVAKTSMSNALSAAGKRQVAVVTLQALGALGACEGSCWLWPSMTMNAYQTAEMLAERQGLGRNRIVPEFSKLDPRGVGRLEGGQLVAVAEEMREGDAASALWRPPRGDNGTPNESATDVLVRTRELLSLLETQFFGESVLIISPDSDPLSILQAGVLGVDLRSHRQYGMAPGEVRALAISDLEWDDQPRSIPCPRPPLCLPD